MAPESRELAYPLPGLEKSVDIEFYHKTLKRTITEHEHPDAILQQFRIFEVIHYKRKTSVQHELVVARADREDGSPLFFLLERSNDKHKIKEFPKDYEKRTNVDEDMKVVWEALEQDIAELSGTKIRVSHGRIARGDFTSTSDSLPDSLLDSSPSMAHDYIKVVEKFEPNECWTEVDHIRPQSLYLYQLAIIAQVVHRRDPIYTLLRHQCYWFAAMIMGTIRQREETFQHTVHSTPIKHAEVLMEISTQKSPKSLSGTFYKISIIRAYPVMIYRLWLNTQAEMQSWQQEIEETTRRNKEQQEEIIRSAHQVLMDNYAAAVKDSYGLQRKLDEQSADYDNIRKELKARDEFIFRLTSKQWPDASHSRS